MCIAWHKYSAYYLDSLYQFARKLIITHVPISCNAFKEIKSRLISPRRAEGISAFVVMGKVFKDGLWFEE